MTCVSVVSNDGIIWARSQVMLTFDNNEPQPRRCAAGAATLLRRLWQVVYVTASVCRSNRSLITVPSTIGIIESAYRLDSTLPSALSLSLSRRPLHTTMQLIAARECTPMHAARRPPGQTPTYPGRVHTPLPKVAAASAFCVC